MWECLVASGDRCSVLAFAIVEMARRDEIHNNAARGTSHKWLSSVILPMILPLSVSQVIRGKA